MSNLFDELLAKAKNKGVIKTAVANPVDEVSLGGAIESMKEGLIEPILIGDKNMIESTAEKYNLDLHGAVTVHCDDEAAVLSKCVEYCKSGDAKALMKGSIHTDHIMSAVVKRDNQLRTDSQISHIFALSMPTYHKILYVTDAAINIYPTLEQKEKLLHNAIDFIVKTGVAKPKVAALSAVESMNPKILGSVEADLLAKNPALQAKAIIEGPLAFDNAISKKAAEIKKINSQVAGDVDLLLTPNLEAGNILFKALVYLANAEVAGVVLGAKMPIILTSRADNAKARLMSSALACLAA